MLHCVTASSGSFGDCTSFLEKNKTTGICFFWDNMFLIWLFCGWPLSLGADVAMADGFDCSPPMIKQLLLLVNISVQVVWLEI